MILDKPIVAIDFDGTLTVRDTRIWKDGVSFNDRFLPRIEAITVLQKIRERIYFILWTCRTGIDLGRALEWLQEEYGLVPDAINENIVTFDTGRKIYADYYYDTNNINDLKCIQFAKH